MSSKRYAYIPEELADKIEQTEDIKIMEAAVQDYINQGKANMQTDLDALDEYVMHYKVMMVKARKEFGEALNAAAEESYAIWESFDKQDTSFKHIEAIRTRIDPIKKDLAEINNMLNKINLYDLKHAVNLMIEFERVSPEFKAMLMTAAKRE